MAEFKIEVSTKPFGDDLQLYRRKEFTFRPGINSLVGCNGSGKTTLIDCFLIPQLRKAKIEYYKYNDRREGGSMLMDSLLNKYGDMGDIYDASEKYSVIDNNGIYNLSKTEETFVDYNAGDYNIKDIEEIRETAPNFENIPLDEIGRVN